jgi:hypothetical protein
LVHETASKIQIWTTIAQAIGGVALLLGLLFTWRNLRATQVKLDIDRQGQLTNRFTQATTQLGEDLVDGRPNVEARLGGIYALEWIARDSPENFWPVMEILTAYVRHNAPRAPAGQVDPSAPNAVDQAKPRTDIQAVLTVLGRSKRPETKDTRLHRKFDLRYTDLRRAEFWDAHLEDTDFYGTHLEDTRFWGAFLDNAKLEQANLEGANLRDASFAGADLRDASFAGADLRGAIFAGADLTGANLSEANLQDADLRYAVGLSKDQIESALQGAGGAKLPQDLDVRHRIYTNSRSTSTAHNQEDVGNSTDSQT